MSTVELGVEMDNVELSQRVCIGRDAPSPLVKGVAAKFVMDTNIPRRCATRLFIKGPVPATWLGAEVVMGGGREDWLAWPVTSELGETGGVGDLSHSSGIIDDDFFEGHNFLLLLLGLSSSTSLLGSRPLALSSES